jgi:hypothetical protein
MVPERWSPPPEGKASPSRPMAPRDSYETRWCVFQPGGYDPNGDTKGVSVALLRVWRGMLRQRGAAPGTSPCGASSRETPRVRRGHASTRSASEGGGRCRWQCVVTDEDDPSRHRNPHNTTTRSILPGEFRRVRPH